MAPGLVLADCIDQSPDSRIFPSLSNHIIITRQGAIFCLYHGKTYRPRLTSALTSQTMAESSLAADLLADFNESENDDDDFGIENGVSHSPDTNGPHIKLRDFMELDDDEEEGGDGDEDMGSVGLPAVHGGSELADDDDEEARKAKVEKMQLGNVDDVRSVAGLMKVLEPVLEVGFTGFRL